MKKLVMSAAILATFAAPAFAQNHYRTVRQPVSVERSQALRAEAYAPRDFAYSDSEQASMLSPSSVDYQPDYNR